VLFVALVPGMLISLPAGGTLVEKAMVHSLVFAVADYFSYKFLLPMLEPFDNPDTKVNPPCQEGYTQCSNGDCILKGEHSTCPGETDAY